MKTTIILFSIFLFGCSVNQDNNMSDNLPLLPVISIQSTSTDTYQEYPVTIVGKTNIDIRSQVDGHITKLFVDEGIYVKKGQALFQIDDRPYLQDYNGALASLMEVEASLIKSQLEIDRLGPLVNNGIISDYHLKAAYANHKLNEASINQAKAIIESAKINLSFTHIKAPISGYISRLPKRVGSIVSRTDVEPLTRLSNIDEMHTYFSLSENDFVKFNLQYNRNILHHNTKNLPPVALILSDNTIYSEKGNIDMIDGQFEKNTGAITLRAVFSNPNGLLRSGNTGKIRLSLHHDNVILVPQSATVEVQDKVFVYALNDSNKVSIRAISVIARSGAYYLIKDGIKSRDRIVSKGFSSIEEGVAIIPQYEEK